MRVLWISFLMIGTINCFPQGGVSNMAIPRSMWIPQYGQEPSRPSYEEPSGQYGGYTTFPGSYSPEPQTGGSGSPMWYTGSYPEQQPAKPTYQRPAQSSGHGSYSGGDSSYSGSGSQQSGSQGAQSGAPGGQYQVEQESWSSSSDDEDEPEFTPVSDEDQVTPCSSRTSVPVPRQVISSGQRFSQGKPLRICGLLT
ncbi:hypothetical protein OJAV_G00058720 [Oryzias javanicus]|uniref:Uncharacterized protein n=1 Tax=Oryzias javanicus TaxID=123683 RepID=A0A3S2MBS3_ORYJA|nr:hypothetical protein OJAV_G00058720 [Oryzias javanicus]